MEEKVFLAIDLGATSGRAVLGTLAGGALKIEEVHRFGNAIMEMHGKYYWNIYSIYEEIKKALAICVRRGIKPLSIGIDTWGVDFGYIASDGCIIGLPRAYRDPYTDGIPEQFFKVMPREQLYAKTGIQIMNFNSLFQLYAAKSEGSEALKNASHILFMPDLFSYMLTGKMVCEYTEASTSQMIDPRAHCFDKELLEVLGVNDGVVLPPVMPGTLVGTLSNGIAEETGIGKIPVYTVAGHDTASAIAAVPAVDDNFAYLSSGTWSLMGVESEQPIISEASYEKNFTNEGGIDGTTCFLKNITGMWLLEQCRKEWAKQGCDYNYPQIVQMAEEATPFGCFVNPDDAIFANPASMTAAIDEFCRRSGQQQPASHAEYVRTIFESLALCYRHTLDDIKQLTGKKIDRLHIIGGGSKNALLNQFTANSTGVTVVAGPSEATAIGNCMVQARAAGIVGDRYEMRRLIMQAVETETFQPADGEMWEKAYEKYKTIL